MLLCWIHSRNALDSDEPTVPLRTWCFTAAECQHVSARHPSSCPEEAKRNIRRRSRLISWARARFHWAHKRLQTLMCFISKMLRSSYSPRITNQCVMLKYNLLTPDHSVPHAQLEYTKQHDMPFMCHFLNPTLHRGIRASQGNQSSCIPAFFPFAGRYLRKGTATFL